MAKQLNQPGSLTGAEQERGDMKKYKTTLLELSNDLVSLGLEDIFNLDIKRDIFFTEDCEEGNYAEFDGNLLIEFKTINLGDKETFLDTEIEITNYQDWHEIYDHVKDIEENKSN